MIRTDTALRRSFPDDAEIDAVARRDVRVIACDAERLVIRTHARLRGTRRSRILAALGAILALPAAALLAFHFLLPEWPLAMAAVVGVIAGLAIAIELLADGRLVAVAGGAGLVVERHGWLRHAKRRRLLVRFDELTGFDVSLAVDVDSGPAPVQVCTLRLFAGTRRHSVWSTDTQAVAHAVGTRLMRLAGKDRPAR